MKPIVHYGEVSQLHGLNVGKSAFLHNVRDHPAGLRGDTVRTSPVIAIDKETGRIETENTIYIPK